MDHNDNDDNYTNNNEITFDLSSFILILNMLGTGASILFLTNSDVNDEPIIPPSKSENQTKIDDIHYPEDAIPKEYLCHISQELMDKPVYDDRAPLFKFDEAYILKWLEANPLNPTHPHTREPLNASNLKQDIVLQNEINHFVAQCIQSHQPKTLTTRYEASLNLLRKEAHEFVGDILPVRRCRLK